MSRPYSEAEPHEKADDEVSLFYIPMKYTSGSIGTAASYGYLVTMKENQIDNSDYF